MLLADRGEDEYDHEELERKVADLQLQIERERTRRAEAARAAQKAAKTAQEVQEKYDERSKQRAAVRKLLEKNDG